MERDRSPVARVLRLRAWLVGIVALPIQVCYFTIFYLVLKTGRTMLWTEQILLIISLWLYLAYIVLINDLADRRIDREAGKATVQRGHGLRPIQIALLLVAIVVANASTVLLLRGGVIFDILWVLSYLLGTAYSVPPFSLKRRGVLGFVADSLIEKPLPILIVFSFFGYYGFEIVLFPLVGEFLDSIFKHQAEDYELDLRTSVRTFAVVLGKRRSDRIVNQLIHPLDAALVIVTFVVVITQLQSSRFVMTALFGTVMVVFCAALSKVRGRMFHPEGSDWPVPPYVGFFNAAFQVFLISALGLEVAITEPAYLPLLILFLFSLFPYVVSYAIISLRRLGLYRRVL